MEEVGFHIVLPFGLKRARMSDYSLVTDALFEATQGSFKHGYFYPFGAKDERRDWKIWLIGGG
jgi:hypothetical protein